MKSEVLENIMTAGKIVGRRGQGCPMEMMLDGLRHWHGGIASSEFIQRVGSRGRQCHLARHVVLCLYNSWIKIEVILLLNYLFSRRDFQRVFGNAESC